MNNESKNNKNNRRLLEHWQQVTIYLVVYDAVAVSLAYFLALIIRFDFSFSLIPYIYLQPWKVFAPFYAVFCIIVFGSLRLYRSIWRFASFTELERITLASIVTTVIHIAGITATLHAVERGTEYAVSRMPISYYIMGALLQFLFITGVRFSYRFILLLRSAKAKKTSNRILIVGAGAAGRTILADLRRTKSVEEQAVCFIDDNKNKWGRDIDGIPVVGANCILGTT